jgi:hypothetical protein
MMQSHAHRQRAPGGGSILQRGLKAMAGIADHRHLGFVIGRTLHGPAKTVVLLSDPPSSVMMPDVGQCHPTLRLL